VAVANALGDGSELIRFISLITSEAFNFDLTNELGVAGHLNGSDNLTVSLNDDVGSVAAEPVDNVSQSEVFLHLIFLSSVGDLASTGSATRGAANSAHLARSFLDFTDLVSVFLDVVFSVLSDESAGGGADTVTTLDFLFNGDASVL
jgi:hypothetical protein